MTLDLALATDWSEWRPHPSEDFTLAVEEEVMLLNPYDWSHAPEIDRVMRSLPGDLARHLTPETQKSALELASGVHPSIGGIAVELSALRRSVDVQLSLLGLRAAAAGTHPLTVWQKSVVSSGARQQEVYGSMRELARREPTFALNVHVGSAS